MSKTLKRSIKSQQLNTRLLQMEADTAGAALAVSGMDDSAIDVASSTYNGVGDITLILKRPFSPTNADKPKAILSALEPDRIAHMYASDYDRVSIRITDLAGAAQEGAISIMIMGTNHRFSY